MKVLAFRPRRPSRAEILRLVARRRPALAGMTRRASPAGSRAKVGAAAEAIPPATPGNAGPSVVRRLTELAVIRRRETRTTRRANAGPSESICKGGDGGTARQHQGARPGGEWRRCGPAACLASWGHPRPRR